jgi:hypothetical protein
MHDENFKYQVQRISKEDKGVFLNIWIKEVGYKSVLEVKKEQHILL